MWYEITLRTVSDSIDLVADVTVPTASPWFDGHFPDKPVLPGIAQLEMVFDLIRQHAGRPLRLVEVNRVRFKKKIVPGDRLTVVATPRQADDTAYAFRLENAEGMVTTGTMRVAEAPERK
jgi:3-hydroxyacyl-[acyl-carrier-protein] dehydratase